MADTHKKILSLVAQTFAGLEDILASELKSAGATDIINGSRAVTFKGTIRTIYKVNLCCRTAIRVLMPIHTFASPDETILFEEIKKMKWEDYLGVDDSFSIEAITATSAMTQSKYIALKAKDAILDRFTELTGKKPSVSAREADLAIHIRLNKDECTVSLDSTGSPLYKRGYRKGAPEANLNEVLAAGLLLMTGWDKSSPLIDPMCGTGTFPIEAALISKNLPPGFMRKSYLFMKWKKYFPYDHWLWNEVRDEAFAKRTHRLTADIIASDISEDAIEKTRECVANAKLSHEIKPKVLPFDQSIPLPGQGIVILNPPTGESIVQEELNVLYKSIGDHLKKKYSGYTCWWLSSSEEATTHIGLIPAQKIKVFNGSTECMFMKFELFDETKKRKVRRSEQSMTEPDIISADKK